VFVAALPFWVWLLRDWDAGAPWRPWPMASGQRSS
jgi:hypothetical protein